MNTIKKIQHNCKQATLLIVKKQSAGLTLSERFRLSVHLAGCSVCRLFEKQSKLINELTRSVFSSTKETKNLDSTFKEQLQHKIDSFKKT